MKLYEQFLQHSPPNEEQVRARIANLKRLLKKREAKPKLAAKPKAKPEPPPKEGHSALWIPGWIAGAAGVALIATGTVLGIMASEKADQLERDYQVSGIDGIQAVEAMREGERLDTAAMATWIAGGVVLAAGATMLVLDLTGTVKSERRAWLAPAVFPGGALVGGGVQF